MASDMLAIVRRHVSLGLKIVLGITVMTFTLYFGFRQMNSGQGTGEGVAIKVGSEEIPNSWWRFFLNSATKQEEGTSKDENSPQAQAEQAKKETFQRLVIRSLLKQFAHSLGVTVTDQELAQKISSQQDFDPVSYRAFIKNFYDENGFSYEDLMREDLLINKFQDWAKNAEKLKEPVEEKGEPQWTFETATLEGADKKEEAEAIQKAWGAGQSGAALLKKNKITPATVGPISVRGRGILFSGNLGLEDYQAIFALSPSNKGLKKPLAKGEKFFLIRLVKKEIPKEEKEVKTAGAVEEPTWQPELSLIDSWFQEYKRGATIKSYLSEDKL